MLRDTSQATAAPSLQRRGRRCALPRTPSRSFRSGTPAPTHSFAPYPRPNPLLIANRRRAARLLPEHLDPAGPLCVGGLHGVRGPMRSLPTRPRTPPPHAVAPCMLAILWLQSKTRRFVCGGLTRKAVNHDGTAHTCHTSKGTHEAAATQNTQLGNRKHRCGNDKRQRRQGKTPGNIKHQNRNKKHPTHFERVYSGFRLF